jgi:hypothetical protein
MLPTWFTAQRRNLWLWLALLAVVAVAVYQLRSQGRLWSCACGYVRLWSSDIKSAENSQQWFDPYSFTHIEHGFLFYGLLALIVPRLSLMWRLWLAIAIESLWEVIENSAFVIQRYREATLALGYQGDTIINSLGDILACGVGFMIARRLGFRRTLALFVLVELILLSWIRDSLILNVVMLLYPIEAIKNWQMSQ